MRGELPVSVVVPHQISRQSFFVRYCLPSIKANLPAEIIVIENDGSRGTGAPFRNEGFGRATQPFVFFTDDDIILAADCLEKLLAAIQYAENPLVRFSYSDHVAVTMPGARRVNEHAVEIVRAREFGKASVRTGSICSSMILIERSAFCGFDETLRQLDDWDLMLTLLEKGVHGAVVSEPLFFAFYLDHGVSDKATVVPAVHAVQRKHGILPGA